MTPRLKAALEEIRSKRNIYEITNGKSVLIYYSDIQELLAAYDAEMSEKCPHGFTRKFDCIECVKEIVNDRR